MIKRLWIIFLIAVLTLSGGIGLLQAAPDQQNTTSITTFTSPTASIERSLLTTRTARIPVTWATTNRPNTSNLVFEQVLPTGQAVNIELPRDNAYVPSSGDGVVAPLDPGAGVNEIHIRVTLRDVIKVQTYDQKEIVIPITAAAAPVIRTFSTNAANVSRGDLTNGTARIPVAWAVDNRPPNSNLVFEQVLDDNSSVNVELPRTVPIVPSSGSGVTAPKPTGGNGTSIVLRLRLVNLADNSTLLQKDISLPIVESGSQQPSISIFSTSATSVSRAALTNKTARIPVSWGVINRPDNTNLVFEQVLDNGSVVNVELPRTVVIVPSEGNGVAAAVAPGGNSTSIKLQVRLINLATQAELAKRDLTVAITDTSSAPTISLFSTTATSVNSAGLAAKSERVPVSWQVYNRPPNSNLVFEQVLSDNSVVNVELPRNNPIVPDYGVGTAAPVTPGGSATSITLQLRLIDLGSQATLDKKTITIPITQPTAPVIASFTTTATSVSQAALASNTARVPVSWQVNNRYNGSNLVFEQVLDNGNVINVELPRTDPIVPSSGVGVTAPAAPTSATVPNITLRLRVIDLATQATLAQQTLTIPIGSSTVTPTIRTFSTSAINVSRAGLTAKTERVPVSWAVDNRPNNTNLVFEQVMDNGTFVNVELPRTVPIVPSSGNGVTAPVAPTNAITTSITLRLRLIDLASQATLAQQTITLPISDTTSGAVIRAFTSGAGSVDFAGLANKTARIPVSWQVDNRPANSNLVFEQVFPGGGVVNVELPRTVPIVPSSGSGVAAAVAPGGLVLPGNITLRLRLVNLANNTTITQSDITVAISGQSAPFVLAVDPTQCYSNGFAPGNGLVVGGRGQVSAQLGSTVLPVYNAARNGTQLGGLPANSAVTVTEGPTCFRYNYVAQWTQLYWRVWKVKADNGGLEGWVTEYEMLPDSSTRVDLTSLSGSSGNTGTPVQITTFTISPNPAARNGAVTFTWAVTGTVSKVSISRLAPDGSTPVILDQQPAQGTGTFTLTNDDINEAGFRLNAVSTTGQETQQDITIAVSCPFSTSLSEDCPVTQATNVASAYQTFEQGQMIWRGDTRKIIVLYGDGSWAEFNDTWTEADGATPGDNAPDGLYKPEHGFGKVWTQIGGQSVLGWATDTEQAYNATWETHILVSNGQITNTPHFTLPDGTVVHTADHWTTG